jgi:hypothetical protein
MTGPTDQRVVVPAGMQKDLTIPAGRYKVVARLLAPGFSPMFAEEEYTPGYMYKSDFVSQ